MDPLVVERAGGVVTLTLNRPERLNAVPSDVWPEIGAVLREVAARQDDRVLVVTGAGRAFCSGADLSSLRDPDRSGLSAMHQVAEVARTLIRLPKPTIARVRGVAAGAGANLALACDLVVAAEDARFCEIFAARGLSLDFAGSWLLPRTVGLHKAKELALLADTLDASQAEAIGLVNKVVAVEELDAAVAEWANRLAAGPPAALSLSKALLNDGATSSLDQALEAEGAAQAYNFSTSDVREALAAYREKRPPKFTGR